jgi:hypothetical protein
MAHLWERGKGGGHIERCGVWLPNSSSPVLFGRTLKIGRKRPMTLSLFEEDKAMLAFLNRVRSLFNINRDKLPELNEQEWAEFRDDPPRYFINRADLPQLRAIWREVERRQ